MTERNDNANASEETVQLTSDLNKWGIPNWCDAEAYGDVTVWTLNRWRWEFFRRRRDLREYFDKLGQSSYLENLALSQQAIGVDTRLPTEPGFCARGSEHTKQEFGYISIPNPRIGQQPEGAIRPFRGYSKLRVTDGSKRDRAVDSHTQIASRQKSVGLSITDEHYETQGVAHFDCFSVQLEPHEVAIKFDLNRPLEPQIEEARELARQLQVRLNGKLVVNRRHPKKWLGYLRTLDAREAGASWSEIAALHSATAQTEQSARDIWEQAKALCFNF